MARPRTDIRERVVRAARARFLAEGVDGASLRTIAKDARTSIGMVFYYFPTKDELFLAVVDSIYPKIVEDLEAALAPDADVRERLRRAFVRLGSASDTEVEVIRLVLRELLVSASSPRIQQVFARFRRGHFGLLFAALADGQRQGDVDPDLPLPIAFVATIGLAAVPQILRRVAGDGLPLASLPPGDTLGEILLGTLFQGIGPRRSPPRARAARRRPPR